jgi:1,4-dihydroxy-2-naphthoate polyprenyltransferase
MIGVLIAWAKRFRLLFLLFIILPVTLGSAIALKYDGGGVSRLYYGLSIAAILLLQAGTIAINEFFGQLSGKDVVNKARRILLGDKSPIPELMKLLPILAACIICLGSCALIGLYIAFTRTLLLLPVGIICLGLGMFHNVPPLRRSFGALGDVAWFISIPLMALGAFIVQVPIVSLASLSQHSGTAWLIAVSCLPMAFIGSAGIMVLEHLDKTDNKREFIPDVYILTALSLLSYASLVAGIVLDKVPLQSAFVFITVPLVALAIWGLLKYQDGVRGIEWSFVFTVTACIITGLAMIVAFL